jgi:hypothetical protein
MLASRVVAKRAERLCGVKLAAGCPLREGVALSSNRFSSTPAYTTSLLPSNRSSLLPNSPALLSFLSTFPNSTAIRDPHAFQRQCFQPSQPFLNQQSIRWKSSVSAPTSAASSGKSSNSNRSSVEVVQTSTTEELDLKRSSDTSSTAQKEEERIDEDTKRTFRERYDDNRQQWRERASKIRTNARGHYDEFTEHPGQSARAGAKSVKAMFQQYGPVFVVTYGSLYLTTLGCLFMGVQSGVLDPASVFGFLGQADETKDTVQLVVDFMQHHSITQPYAHVVESNPTYANLAVAWIATKFTEPVRLAVALPITPKIARYLGYAPKTAVEKVATLEPTDTAGTNEKPGAKKPRPS